MSWEFIYLSRDGYRDSGPWGDMYIKNESGGFDWLCHSYELPWKEYSKEHGSAGKSISSKSRIKIGTYELKSRSNGSKGWRLELQGTGHRTNIQIHRAHKSLYIEGCILPLHVDNFDSSGVNSGDKVIQTESVSLMTKIKNRYNLLNPSKTGNATVTISARLPASIAIDNGARYA